MSFSVLDWLIVIIPVAFVLWTGYYSRRYLRDITDFLSAGRVCGRYVISVGDIAAALSILGLVAYVEVHYKTGFALAFWNMILLPVGVLMSLFGYCTYRFRETKAQSLGQFLEMRYSRKFRIFAAGLRSLSEMLANMIMPALAARFFIYFLDLPHTLHFAGMNISTFNLLMVLILVAAISIICMGGTLAIIVTDTVQGFLCYPLLVVFVIFILVKFSWSNEIMTVMSDRGDGESFLNPYDISKLQDFNIFFLIVTVMATFLHRASWIGCGGSSNAARSPHEQKMAGLLGTWRQSLGLIFYLLIAVAILTVMNHRDFAGTAQKIRLDMSSRIAEEVVENPEIRSKLNASLAALPAQIHTPGVDRPLTDKHNLDTTYLDAAHQTLKTEAGEDGNVLFQEFRTLYYQLMLPVAIRNILPTGMLGLFCVLMILLMISTDTGRIFSATLTLSQDVVLPLRKKPFTPRQHMWLLRWVAIAIGVFFFIGSSYMAQLDYINLFVTLMTIMWLGGCGPVMIFGLYSRFGTTAGAWTSLLTGMGMAFAGMAVQRNWADYVYPWLDRVGWVDSVGSFLGSVSAPFNPYIIWEMNPVKCPINSYEWYFITMLVTLFLYCTISWLTCKEPYNLERMLHRGKYSIDGERKIESAWSWQTLYAKLIGITPEYTTGDKVIAWAFFGYSIVYQFFFAFLVIVVWNIFDPWPIAWWGYYFLVTALIVPGIMAAITAVWFGIGGAIDLVRMFRDLEARRLNPLDDGRVEGHISLADQAEFAHIEEEQPVSEQKKE